jgi:hypothetical protein
MPDRLSALVQFLQADTALYTKVNGRVYSEELPDNVVSRMPVPCILLLSAGGSHSIGAPDNDFSDSRIDVRCYAWKTIESCRALESEVYNLLRRLTRAVVGDTLLHWCRSAGGPIPIRSMPIVWPGGVVDESTHWPYVQRSWQVLAADIPVPVP